MQGKSIILVSGPLGAGKSSLCTLIRDEFGFFHIDGDAFFVPLEKTDLSWEERLQQSWQWIVKQTREHIQNGENVVIDFVVEGELFWFLKQTAQLDVQVTYVVLVADEATIKQRLEKRDGGLQYFERSKVLRDQLENDPQNKKHLLDTTEMTTREVLNEVMNNKRFDI